MRPCDPGDVNPQTRLVAGSATLNFPSGGAQASRVVERPDSVRVYPGEEWLRTRHHAGLVRKQAPPQFATMEFRGPEDPESLIGPPSGLADTRISLGDFKGWSQRFGE